MTGDALSRQDVKLGFHSVSRSHPGLRRSLNEDRVLERPAEGVWAIADGMGGHREGDVAATRLVEALGSLPPNAVGYARLSEVEDRVGRINADLYARGQTAGATGSTLVLLLAHEGHYACVWAGDSRAYRFREGGLCAITRDHSLVQELVDTGVLDDARRHTHPSAHVVTRAVGAAAELKLDQRFAPIEAGDVFLLCSDGLTACLSDAAIAEALRLVDLSEAADRLLSEALEGGAPDNVSLVLIRAE